MNINWKVRLKNKWFWVTVIPAVLLLVQQVAAIFGVAIDFDALQEQLIAVVGTAFGILALLGVAVDMTTEGIGDSARAMAYESPYDGKAVTDSKNRAEEEAAEAREAAAKHAKEVDNG